MEILVVFLLGVALTALAMWICAKSGLPAALAILFVAFAAVFRYFLGPRDDPRPVQSQ